ncbi:MAG: cytochrome c [Gammaproteobacteria bacterium]|nr:cytochrome c [Gammaproteobacteria bacterium]
MNNLLNYLLIMSMTLLLSPALAGDIEKGKTKSELCVGCHGENGISVSPIIPNLAGQKEAYLVNSLKDFKSGARKNGMMSPVAATISDDDINDIAAYFSSLK